MNVKKILSNHIDDVETSDLTASIMTQIRSGPSKSKRSPLLVAVIVLMLSTSVFGISIKLIHLSEGHTVTLDEGDLYEPKPSPMDNFHGSTGLYNKPGLTIYIKDPLKHSIFHHGSFMVYKINELPEVYPNFLGDFQFNSAMVSPKAIHLSDTEILDIAKEHEDQDFFTIELQSEGSLINHITYENKETGLLYDVVPTAIKDNINLKEKAIKSYEVIEDLFVYEQEKVEFTEINGELNTNEITNNFMVYLFIGDTCYKIKPHIKNAVYPDIKIRHVYAYPDVTKEDLIDIATRLKENIVD